MKSLRLKAALEQMNVILPHVAYLQMVQLLPKLVLLPFDIIRLRKSDNSGPIVDPDRL